MVVVASVPSSGVRRLAPLVLALAAGIAGAACSSNSDADPIEAEPLVLVDLTVFDGIEPGDVIALRAANTEAAPSSTDVPRNGTPDDGTPDDSTASGDAGNPTGIEWIERRTGRILRLPLGSFVNSGASADDVEVVATIDVSTEGEQRGLLGHTVVNGVRYVAFTQPIDDHLVVAALDGRGSVERIVWDGGGTAGGAVGGHLETGPLGTLILGIGQLTDSAKANGSGAMLQLDPLGAADQEPVVLSSGYTNPFAFVVGGGGQLWVADNAVGDDVEHIGRGDLLDRGDHAPTDAAPRAPSAMVALGDGRLGVCGFLDAQLLVWTDASGYGEALGPCLTGATTLTDGSIVTATDSAIVLLPVQS